MRFGIKLNSGLIALCNVAPAIISSFTSDPHLLNQVQAGANAGMVALAILAHYHNPDGSPIALDKTPVNVELNNSLLPINYTPVVPVTVPVPVPVPVPVIETPDPKIALMAQLNAQIADLQAKMALLAA